MGASSKRVRGPSFVSAQGEMFSLLPLPLISHLQNCDTFAQRSLSTASLLPQEPGFFQIKNPVLSSPSCGERRVIFEPIFQMLMKSLRGRLSHDAAASGRGLTRRGRSNPSRDILRNAHQSGQPMWAIRPLRSSSVSKLLARTIIQR